MPRVSLPSGPRDADATVRVFFALWPDSFARDALAALARDTGVQAQGRAPAAANLHLTLAFLGDVAATRIDALQAIGLAAASAVPSFTLTLDRTGGFRDAGIAWAGASAPPSELLQLARILGQALAADGFAIERRAFHPHVTLARRCRKRSSVGEPAPIAWEIARLTLNASEGSSRGPRYRELGSWRLGPPASGDMAS
jgi:2'-5' RNA ligase